MDPIELVLDLRKARELANIGSLSLDVYVIILSWRLALDSDFLLIELTLTCDSLVDCFDCFYD